MSVVFLQPSSSFPLLSWWPTRVSLTPASLWAHLTWPPCSLKFQPLWPSFCFLITSSSKAHFYLRNFALGPSLCLLEHSASQICVGLVSVCHSGSVYLFFFFLSGHTVACSMEDRSSNSIWPLLKPTFPGLHCVLNKVFPYSLSTVTFFSLHKRKAFSSHILVYIP